MSLSQFDLSGRRALVTGSSRGLGLVIARGLAEAGAELVLNGRDAGRVDAAIAELSAAGHTVSGRAFDVTDSAAVDAAVAGIEAEPGAIDIVVNNAGIHRRAPLEEMSDAQWQEVIDANLSSAFYVSRAVGQRMIGRGRGKIIMTCSVMSEIGRPTVSNYSAAKGGLRMLVRNMCVEWAQHNIQINGIGPGYFLTELTRALHDDEDFNRWICARTPAGRWGDPAELTGAAVFLASDASNYVNGQILYVDGGVLAAV